LNCRILSKLAADWGLGTGAGAWAGAVAGAVAGAGSGGFANYLTVIKKLFGEESLRL